MRSVRGLFCGKMQVVRSYTRLSTYIVSLIGTVHGGDKRSD